VLGVALGAALAGLARYAATSETRAAEQRVLELYRTVLLADMEMVRGDLRMLAEQNDLLAWLDGTGPLAAVEADYLGLARNRRVYDQVRLLDDAGQEVVRVNYNAGAPSLVSAEGLQNKAARYYFRDAWPLERGQVYASPLDLNIEGSRIEVPFKPMIRFATPVFDRRGTKRGVVVLNYLGSNAIDALRRASGLSAGELSLLNADGYWLLAPGPEDEWGFMFDAGKGVTFGARYPRAWRRIREADAGQFHDAGALLSFITVAPLAPGTVSASGSADPAGGSERRLAAEAYLWKVVSRVPGGRMLGIGSLQTGAAAALAAGWVLTVAAFAWVAAHTRARSRTYRAEIERMARLDPLTGLPNRAFFLDRLEQAVREAVRYRHRMALLVIDLDGFKLVNDAHGHATGDRLLVEVGGRLQAAVRRTDTVGRMGGDEFTVCLSRVARVEDAEQVAQKILDRLREPAEWRAETPLIGASIGLSRYPEDGARAEDLLHAADVAMYEAKRAGKNTFRSHTHG
jgi:diguanylate cyclase (GGDEF)-like protein